MQNSGIDLPTGAGFQFIGAGKIENFVVAVVPFFQAPTDIVLGGARVQPHERVREIVVLEIVLRGEIIRFGLALLSDPSGELVVLMKMMRDGSKIVEELAQ